jgi:hypothetical protein
MVHIRGERPVLIPSRRTAVAAVAAAVVVGVGCGSPFRATGRVNSITAETICLDPPTSGNPSCYVRGKGSPPADHVRVGDCVRLTAKLESVRITELKVLPTTACASSSPTP